MKENIWCLEGATAIVVSRSKSAKRLFRPIHPTRLVPRFGMAIQPYSPYSPYTIQYHTAAIHPIQPDSPYITPQTSIAPRIVSARGDEREREPTPRDSSSPPAQTRQNRKSGHTDLPRPFHCLGAPFHTSDTTCGGETARKVAVPGFEVLDRTLTLMLTSETPPRSIAEPRSESPTALTRARRV